MDTKNLIFNNALELFSNKGYDATGVQEICTTSGITKPTLYHHFGSKKGLLDELLNHYFGILNSIVKSRCEYKGDLVKTMESIVEGYFIFAKENKLFYRSCLAFSLGPPESEATISVVERMKEQYNCVEEMFKKAVIQHGNMRDREKIYAASFIGMINTYISMNYHGYFSLDSKEIYRAVHQFMHGILS